MPRLKSDLVDLLEGCAKGALGEIPAEHDPRTAVAVIAVSGGYPGSYPKGKEITGELAPASSIVFHAGTKREADGRLLTSGGRVLAVTSYGSDITDALGHSYEALGRISFDGMNYRSDIGRDLMKL